MEGQRPASGGTDGSLSQTVQNLLSTSKEDEALQLYVGKSEPAASSDEDEGRGSGPAAPGKDHGVRRGRPSQRRGVSMAQFARKVQEKRRLLPKSLSKSSSASPGRSPSPAKSPSGPPSSRVPSGRVREGPSSGSSRGSSRRGQQQARRKTKEELYTDKDRAAAVNLGSKDIKQDLHVKKKQERKLLFEIPDHFDPDVFVLQADKESKRGLLDLAMSTLNKALELDPNNKKALVARSQCYMRLGDSTNALKDVEAALREDPKFPKGILQKAETLYHMGMFELALVQFHQGYRIRNDIADFRLGIQKAQEAIQNSVCHKSSTSVKHDMALLEKHMKEMEEKEQQQLQAAKSTRKLVVQQRASAITSEKAPHETANSRRISKELLGPLYHDKTFLEKLLTRKELTQNGPKTNMSIKTNVKDTLNYLRTREDFWRQQKPMYARNLEKSFSKKVKERAEAEYRSNLEERKHMQAEVAKKMVNKTQEDIERCMTLNRPRECVLECDRALKSIGELNIQALPTKKQVIAYIYNTKGQALLLLKNLEAAINVHSKELQIAEEVNSPEIKARAQDWLGRAFAMAARYAEAVQTWEARIPAVVDPTEKAWLLHELGRCYLEMEKAEEAHSYAKKCLNEASKLEKSSWNLNATMLKAQAEIKLGKLDDAKATLSSAKEIAQEEENEESINIIKQAQENVEKEVERKKHK